MSGFLTTYSTVDTYDILAEGIYETVINEVSKGFTKTGNEKISIKLTIRNDIEQNYINWHVWYNIHKVHSPTEADTECEGYSSWAINNFSRAIGLDEFKCFESINDWISVLELYTYTVRVRIEHVIWNGSKRVQIAEVMSSEFPDNRHVFK